MRFCTETTVWTDDVHVRVFDNRVEVESPGRLPAHVTPENILEERFARNPSWSAS